MAREHARILCSVWRPGDDFRDRSPEAQRLYFLLLSQRELNNAGVMPVMVSKWARCSAGTTTGDIEKALAELVEHRYVVVDWDTEELLIRSFMRNDGILKHPYTRRSALRSAEQIESRALRSEAARELVRTGHPEGIETAMRLDPDAARTSQRDGIAMPSNSVVEQPDSNPSEQPDSMGSIPRRGWGGEGEGGRGTSVGGQVGETPARPSERCKRHAAVEADGPCGGCGSARKAAERWDAEQADAVVVQRATRRELIERCPDCDDNGMRDLGVGLTRCTHPNLVEVPS